MLTVFSPFLYHLLPILPFNFAVSPIMWKAVLSQTKSGLALGLVLDSGMR